MDEQPGIEQIPEDTPKAYSALVDYAMMGADRSLAKLAEQYGKPPSYVRQLQRWSAQYNWQARIKKYEEESARSALATTASVKYREALEGHRKRYLNAGIGLANAGGHMLKAVLNFIDARMREADETRTAWELEPKWLPYIIQAFEAAGDLEAHALNLESLMDQLTDRDDVQDT